jgi:hypothetical protein
MSAHLTHLACDVRTPYAHRDGFTTGVSFTGAPCAPHLLGSTPEIEALRPKSPPRNGPREEDVMPPPPPMDCFGGGEKEVNSLAKSRDLTIGEMCCDCWAHLILSYAVICACACLLSLC